ncbi:U3 snoRNP-associated protein Utp1 [Aphelenchoides avenae]|nr:U3 snoRNP-associated protein Utp1 [Aphelenchus avenae]
MNCNYQFTDVVGTVYKNANVQFLPDGNTVLSLVGNKLKQFNLRENLSSTLPTETNFNIRHVALHPAGTHAFVVNDVGYCLYVSIVNRIILHRVKMGNDVPYAEFAPNGKKLAICVGGQVKIYSTVFCTAGQFNPFIYLCRRKLSNEPITTVRWSRDGRQDFIATKLLVCGSEDKQVRVFSSDRQFANMSLFAMSQRAPIVDCFFVGEGYDVVSVDKRGMAIFWESTFQPKDLVLSPEHKLDENLEKMSYSKARRCQMLEHCGSGMSVDVTAVALNEPANIIVCGFSNGVFVICELPEFNLIQNMRVGEIPVTTLNLSPAGDWLGIGCGHGSEAQLLVWEWQSETYVLKQQSHSQNIVSAAYSPDGLHLATGAEDGKVKIWNCQTSFCIVTFAEHNAAVSCVAWTQNGKAILSSSLEGTVRAHDMKR